MSQEMTTTFHIATSWCFKCPYQAMVMNVLEIVSRMMVISAGRIG